MTGQAQTSKFLNGPPAGFRVSLAYGLPVAVLLSMSNVSGKGQESPAQPATAAQPAAQGQAKKKAPAEPAEKKAGQYLVHQSLELGGRITSIQGSQGMWNTLVDMGSGGRILGQSLEMRSLDPAKTPFFDTLTTSSFGYGGDPNDVSYLNASKGRIYNFAGSFRRDRQYFDYNLLANSLNTNSAGLVPENDSPHLFNTVRRNTDAQLTLLPLSRVNIRAGFNYNISAGPSYSSIHEGADALLFQMWSNANETYSGGVDVKLAPRTTLSYDQFFVHYKGNTSWELAGLNATLPNGAPVSYGLDPGSGPCPGVRNGVGLASCNGYLGLSIFEPIRTNFPTEQLRFSTHYWSRVSMNARILYNDGKSTVPRFNEFYDGLTTRTNTRQEIDTGAGPGGQLSTTKRDDVNADYGLVADLAKFLTVSDAFNYWAFRLPGSNDFTSTVWAAAQGTKTTLLTPISSLIPATSTTTNLTYLNQKIGQNTALAIFTVLPSLKLSGGYRFKTRNIADYGPDNLTWHENWALLGAVIRPDPAFRVNVDYEHMNSASADSATPSDTYTRLMPDLVNHVRVRATAKPAKWFSVAAAVNDYQGKNDDPLVNHTDHNRDLSVTASVSPTEKMSLDIDVAHDDVASQTDICYEASKPPAGATNSGTCTVAASGVGVGDPSYLLGNGYYHAPATFVAGSIRYAPTRLLRLNAGARLNDVSGQDEMLNPNQVAGALFSKYATPFADAQFDIAREWTWHGNWVRDDYSEQGPFGIVAPRNVHGDIVTLGVKYAF
jgi:hypothetical protein